MVKIKLVTIPKIFFITFFLLAFGCTKEAKKCSKSKTNIVTPTTVVIPETVNSFTPQRLIDLSRIVIALEKYKRDHNSYPISAESGNTWNSLIVDSQQEINENWISGLVPNYINALPRDPRMSNLFDQQYRYRSNGAHYILLSLRPDDCNYVKSKLPEIIYHLGECWAYGFWTQGAARW